MSKNMPGTRFCWAKSFFAHVLWWSASPLSWCLSGWSVPSQSSVDLRRMVRSMSWFFLTAEWAPNAQISKDSDCSCFAVVVCRQLAYDPISFVIENNAAGVSCPSELLEKSYATILDGGKRNLQRIIYCSPGWWFQLRIKWLQRTAEWHLATFASVAKILIEFSAKSFSWMTCRPTVNCISFFIQVVSAFCSGLYEHSWLWAYWYYLLCTDVLFVSAWALFVSFTPIHLIEVKWYVGAGLNGVIGCCIAIPLMPHRILAPLLTGKARWSITYSRLLVLLLLVQFTWSLMAPCLALLFVQVVPAAVRHYPAQISMGQSVADNSSRRPSVNFDWCEAFELMADVLSSDCSASDAQSDDFVLYIPPSSIFTVSVVDESMQYGPTFSRSEFLYESVPIRFVAVAVKDGQLK